MYVHTYVGVCLLSSNFAFHCAGPCGIYSEGSPHFVRPMEWVSTLFGHGFICKAVNCNVDFNVFMRKFTSLWHCSIATNVNL